MRIGSTRDRQSDSGLIANRAEGRNNLRCFASVSPGINVYGVGWSEVRLGQVVSDVVLH